MRGVDTSASTCIDCLYRLVSLLGIWDKWTELMIHVWQISSPIPHSIVSDGKNTQITEMIWAVSDHLDDKTGRESDFPMMETVFG